MSAVNFDDLKPEDQELVKAKLEGRAPRKVSQEAIVAQQNRRAGAQKRRLTGDNFEAEIDVTCAAYEFRKWGKIRRNYIPTKVVGRDQKFGTKRVAAGPAHVDRTGWSRVQLVCAACSHPLCLCQPSREPTVWAGATPHQTWGRIIPIAFECKVMDESQRRGWYFHDKDLQHQLHDLKAAAEAGEYAFLLVLSRKVGRVFAIPIQEHYTALLSGQGVQLYDHDNEDIPLFPSITKRAQEIGWDWIPLLQHCAPQ